MNTSIDPGEGWRLLQPGEPLQKGDGFLHPVYKTIWLNYECRPNIFRARFGVVEPGLEVNREYAHTYPWRRRISGTSKSEELKKACWIVERYARAIGKDCQMILTNEGAEVAPLSWSGSSTGETLYDALIDAMHHGSESK